MTNSYRFFHIEKKTNEFLNSLSNRLHNLVVAAVNYHSLIQPNRTLHYKIYMGRRWQYPRLTDTSTLNGSVTEGDGLVPLYEFDAISTVEAQSFFSPHYFAGDQQIIDHNIRYILLTPDDATDEDVQEHQPNLSRKSKLYNELEFSVPVLFDRFRELQRRERERAGRSEVEPYQPATVDLINKSGHSHHPWVEVHPGNRIKNAPKAVIIAMHWLQAGGAERWGMETIALAKEAGFLPIVLTDRDSHQPWISDPVCDGALVMPLTQPLQDRVGDAPILRALFEQFDIRGVIIHHCQWMYDKAWWVKQYYPQVCIVDSLHIVEYINSGGYPRESVARDKWIDLHHVISPQLEHWMVDIHHIASSKVIDAPLIGLTADPESIHYAKRKGRKDSLTVAFIGRMARQKRPEAFVLAAKAINKARPNSVHFIMHGSGEMDAFVDRLIEKNDLKNIIERRSMATPVSKTYEEADVLLISSVNEGITLTTIEAITSGIPTISANVGSQETLIPPQGLLKRMTSEFIQDARRAVLHLLDQEEDRQRLWDAERRRLESFSHMRTANVLFQKLFAEWSK